MEDVNIVVVSGRITRQPDYRKTPDESTVLDIHIACNRYINGEQRTTFLKITLWNKAADLFHKQLDTGDSILVKGILVDDNFIQSFDDGTESPTTGRLKIDNPRITLLKKSHDVSFVAEEKNSD